MPLLQHIQLDADSSLGIWQVEENPEDLKWQLQWGQTDIEQYKALNDEQRSMHWLTSRVLLRKMLNTSKFIDLQQDEHGKPYIRNFDQKLSISHSADRVVVLLSKYECGIDIEKVTKRVTNVANKFVSEEEWKYIDQDESYLEQLHIYWCAKEALYKLYGRRKLDFREHLFLYPFKYSRQGKIRGRIEKKEYFRELPIYYLTIDDYIMVYVIDQKG